MSSNRVYNSKLFFVPSDDEPFRSVVKESSWAVIVAWHVKPGQIIMPHTHPLGQDTWTILSGHGLYIYDSAGSSQAISAGDVVIAEASQVHGVHNIGQEPLTFISVVCPANAGFKLL